MRSARVEVSKSGPYLWQVEVNVGPSSTSPRNVEGVLVLDDGHFSVIDGLWRDTAVAIAVAATAKLMTEGVAVELKGIN